MKKSILALTLGCFACSISLYGQSSEPLSLQEFRLRAIDSSQKLKITKENTTSSESQFKMIRTGFYPSLNVAAEANYFVGNPAGANVALKDYYYNASLTLQQTIYAGNSVSNRTKAAKIELEIAQLNDRVALENVIYSADVIYWAVVASDKQLGVMSDYVKIVEDLHGIVNDRFDNGYISRTDLLMVETRLNEAKLQQLTARKLYDNSMQNLNSLLQNRDLTLYALTDTLSAPLAMPELQNTDVALANRPDYKIAQRNIDLQNQNVRVTRGKYNPQLVAGISGVYGTLNPNLSGQNVGYGVAYLNFSAPIFHFNERRHDVSMARSAVRVAEYTANDTQNSINQDLNNAHTNIIQTFEQTRIAGSNLEIAQQNLELNTYSYAEGRLPILDVLSAQLAWIQSYTAAVNSNYQYRISLADYALALGVLSQEVQ